MFVVFEGIDGCGKSTQAEMCRAWLKSKGRQVLLTHEPTNSVVGKIIKKHVLKGSLDTPILDAHLFCADREIHTKEQIIPQLKSGGDVVCDRYYHSTICYHANQGLSKKWLIMLQEFALKPDIVFVIDREPSASYKSVLEVKGENNLTKFENPKFLKSLRKHYVSLPGLMRKDNIIIINGNDIKDNIHSIVKGYLRDLL
jgi:dTMP kinase